MLIHVKLCKFWWFFLSKKKIVFILNEEKNNEVGTKMYIRIDWCDVFKEKKNIKKIRSPFMSLKVELVMLGDGSRRNEGISMEAFNEESL